MQLCRGNERDRVILDETMLCSTRKQTTLTSCRATFGWMKLAVEMKQNFLRLRPLSNLLKKHESENMMKRIKKSQPLELVIVIATPIQP